MDVSQFVRTKTANPIVVWLERVFSLGGGGGSVYRDVEAVGEQVTSLSPQGTTSCVAPNGNQIRQ